MSYITNHFDERVVDQGVFVLFFALFSRDQSFYLLAVITSCLYLAVFAKLAVRAPHAYYVDEHLEAPFCSHASGLGFGYPAYPVMLAVCFDVTMYLTVFHTVPGMRDQNEAADRLLASHRQSRAASATASRASKSGSVASLQASILLTDSLSARSNKDLGSRERRKTMLTFMRKKLDFTNDNFENDLMVLPHFELKSRRARVCVAVIKRLLFIVFILLSTVLQFSIAIFKGRQDADSLLVAAALGVWLAVHMFVFYRKAIQNHVRSILEFNEEFRQEHMIHHSLDLTRNCWIVFGAWGILNLVLQVTIHVASNN